jgi:methylthioribose-1-phosphate isomerase
VDLATPDGDGIPIEERAAKEVLLVRGVAIAPMETDVRNPSFDVTPAELITGIVTDEGVIRAPYGEGLAAAVARRDLRRSQTPGFHALWKATAPSADEGPAAEAPAADVPAAVES